MNTFSQYIKNKDQKGVDRVRIRSKLFGEYEPDLYILSRSKSRSKSTSKDPVRTQLTGLKSKRQPSNFISSCDNLNLYQPCNFAQSCNQQSKNLEYKPKDSANLSQFQYLRNNSQRLKTEKTAIEKIFEWVQRKYYSKVMNKIFQTPTLNNNNILNQTKIVIKQQQSHKQIKKPNLDKLMYDLYILHSLKNKDRFSKYQQLKKISHSSQKNLHKPQISLNKGQQISTMNSIEVLDFTINPKIHNNLGSSSNSIQSQNQITQNYAFSHQNLKDSISFQNTHDFLQNKNQINHQQSLDIKIPKHLNIEFDRKINNQTSMCDQKSFKNNILISQRKSQSLLPTVKNQIEENIQKTQQILKEVLQMNSFQSSILKIIKNQNLQNKNNNYPQNIPNIQRNSQTLPFQYQKISKTLNNPLLIQERTKRVRPVTNYYTQHFSIDVNKNSNLRTFVMPIIRSQTEEQLKNIQQKNSAFLNNFQSQYKLKSPKQKNTKTQVFSFKSLTQQNNSKQLNQPSQYYTQRLGQFKNAFVKNCDIFGICKTANNTKEIDRSNHMTQTSTMRERETSCNSNQSKNSKKPKVSFKYVFPSVKFNQKVNQNEYQNSRLQSFAVKESQKNIIMHLNQNKISNNFNIDKYPCKKVNIVAQNIDHEKQRSFSLQRFHLNQNKIKQFEFVQQTRKNQERQPSKVQNLNKKSQNEQINLAYYKSQKNLINKKNDSKNNQRNLRNMQFYYFPLNKQNNGYSMTQSNTGVGLSFNTLSRNQKRQEKIVVKNKDFMARNDHRYLFPLTNSIEKNRLERTKSMNERIQVTFKKYQ